MTTVQSARPLWARCLVALGLVVAALLVREHLLGVMAGRSPYATFYLAVMFSALYGGFLPGALATACSAPVVAFFLVEPTGSFYLGARPDQVASLVFVADCLMLSWIVGAAQRAQARAQQALVEAEYAHERERASSALLASERMLSFVMRQCGIGGWMLDPDTGSVRCTPDMDRIFGYHPPREGWSYQLFLDHIHEEDRDKVSKLAGEAFAANAGWSFECRIRRVDGAVRWIRAAGGCQDAECGQQHRVAGIVQDITDLKQAEASRHDLEIQLLHTQKLESLGILAGGIAHDFNNILTSIIGNANLAQMRLHSGAAVGESLQRIEQAAARAADLTRQMLAYSGKGRFMIESVDFGELLTGMVQMLEVSVAKKAALRLEKAPDLPPVEADATQIRQVVMNLVINASEAIGDASGLIAITASKLQLDRSTMPSGWVGEAPAEGLYVMLQVTDTGCGMDRSTINRIFDPFFTTKFTGRGLGMAAVLGIVKGHKGAIMVKSEVGRGSTFTVVFPASDNPVPKPAPAPTSQPWRGSGSVLLVDDEETVLSVGAEMLQALGFQVITAEDGERALEAYRNNPDIGFVVLDLTMPIMDGEQCFRELRRIDPGIKVFISSGYSKQEATRRFSDQGLSGFIQKPYNLDGLRSLLSRAGEGVSGQPTV